MLCKSMCYVRCWPYADAEEDHGKSGAAVKGGLGNSSKTKGKPGAQSTKAPLTGFAAFQRKLCKALFGWMDPKYVVCTMRTPLAFTAFDTSAALAPPGPCRWLPEPAQFAVG